MSISAKENQATHRGLTPPPTVEDALAYPVSIAAKRLSIGTTLAWELVRAGKLRSFRVGRRVLVPRVALEEFIRQQLEEHAG